MQFNRKFLIVSLIFIVFGVLAWNTVENNNWFNKDASEAPDSISVSPEAEGRNSSSKGAEGPSDTLDKAINSLNTQMGGKEAPVLVEAAPVLRGTLIQNISAQGRVHAYLTTNISNEVAGRLVRLHITDGQKVKKGEILAEIDDREYLLDYEEAKSNYLSAQADFVAFDETLGGKAPAKRDPGEAIKELEEKLKDGTLGEGDFRREKLALELEMVQSGSLREQVIAAKYLDQARIKLEKTKIKLGKCKVYAPFDGMIFEVAEAEGALLGASAQLARLVNMNDLVIKAKVLESEMGQVYQGRTAKISYTALPDLGPIKGKIQAVSPFVNEEDKTVETIVRFNNVDGRIRPGMFAEVDIDSQMFEDRLMVPKLAILPRDNRKVVFKVSDDNRAKWVYVTTGVENDEYVEITSANLEPGDLVLTDNHFTMGHDTLVKVANKK